MIHEAELDYLKHVSTIFGFDDARFEQLVAQHIDRRRQGRPYVVLGLAPNADRAEVRKVYRQLVAEHHPDRLIAKGVPEELLEMATARMAAINHAYSRIMKTPPALPAGAPDASAHRPKSTRSVGWMTAPVSVGEESPGSIETR